MNRTKKTNGPKKYYAVKNGRNPGVYETWGECKGQVDGFSGNNYKSFDNYEDAKEYIGVREMESNETIKKQKYDNRKDEVENRKENRYFETIDLEFERNINNEKKNHIEKTVPLKPKKLNDELDKEIIIYTDGSCLGNGKEGCKAGYGIHFPNKEYQDVSEPLPNEIAKNDPTNNKAELYSIIQALKIVPTDKKIILYTDSEYCLNGITSWIFNWKKDDWKKEIKNKELWQKVDKLMKKRTRIAEFKKVKAHSDNVGNQMADKLATDGSRKRKKDN